MSTSDWALAFSGDRLLLMSGAEEIRVPTRGEMMNLLGERGWGEADSGTSIPPAEGRPCHALELTDDFEAPEGYELVGLRASHALIPLSLFRAAGTARQRVEWLRTHRFCARCGTALERHDEHQAMSCGECGQLHFPRLSPAVIVLVQRGREILLGRSPHFSPGVYSTLAGFVEPGESLEECVHREIEEEVGVTVSNLHYFGSQPHPFPHSLMVGFVADWADGEIRIDPSEIEDARWFTADRLPDLPHSMSIASALIADFVKRDAGS